MRPFYKKHHRSQSHYDLPISATNSFSQSAITSPMSIRGRKKKNKPHRKSDQYWDDLSMSPTYQFESTKRPESKINLEKETKQDDLSDSDDIFDSAQNDYSMYDTKKMREQKKIYAEIFKILNSERPLSSEKIDKVIQLIDSLEDLNLQDLSGKTLLYYIVENMNRDFIEILDFILSRKDVNVNIRNKNGVSPLDIAVLNANLLLVKKLLPKNPKLNETNFENETPLNICCKYGILEQKRIEIAKLLLDFGANPDIFDKNQDTPLHHASKKGSFDLVKLLLTNKADNRVRNSRSQTALDCCEEKSIQKILEDYDPVSKTWKWEVDLGGLKFNKDDIIGKGAFGIVYKARMYGSIVALKLMDVDNLYEKPNYKASQQALLYEAGLMCDIRHPNILSFMGIYKNGNSLGIITEYCSKGSLHNFIRNRKLTWKDILLFSIETARGLAWLHSRFPPILHRDLHTKNILITEHGECKVADFGLSQLQGSIKNNNKFYKRIMPPEFRDKDKVDYTKKSDVYMYGLIMYELVSKTKACGDNFSFSLQKLETIMNNCDKMNPISSKYFQIIRDCCEENPQNRPYFESIIERLESIIEKLHQNETYIDLDIPDLDIEPSSYIE